MRFEIQGSLLCQKNLFCLIWCCWFQVKSAKALRRRYGRVERFLSNEPFSEVTKRISGWINQARLDTGLEVVRAKIQETERIVGFKLVYTISVIYFNPKRGFCQLILEVHLSNYSQKETCATQESIWSDFLFNPIYVWCRVK